MQSVERKYILDTVQPIVNCELHSSERSVYIRATDIGDNILSIVGFSAKNPSTQAGLEIIKSALIACVIGKFRKSLAINLNFSVDPRTLDFLNNLNADVIGSLNDSRTPLLVARKMVEIHPEPIIGIPNEVLIGNSGGRDSFAAADILKECGFQLHDYKIAYDQARPSGNADYSTYEFDGVRNNTDTSYEPFDIPLTYFAPLWSVKDRIPQNIAIGHSFDVLGFDSNQRAAPYESPMAMRLHQQYLDNLLGRVTNFTFPIATLSTYSVFEYIRRKYGIAALEARVSCWNGPDDDCGFCDKCQRVKLASTSMHVTNYQYLPSMPQVIDNHGYLFGNPAYDNLAFRYPIDSLADSQLFTENLPLNERVTEHLARVFSGRSMSVGYQTDKKELSASTVDNKQNIANKIGLDYGSMPSQRLHEDMRMMPYEQYFARSTPTLSAHGEIPFFVEGGKWKYRRIGEGPRLEVPDSELFRKFFNQSKYA